MKFSNKVLIKYKRFGKILYLVLPGRTTEVGVAIKFTLCKITIRNDTPTNTEETKQPQNTDVFLKIA